MFNVWFSYFLATVSAKGAPNFPCQTYAGQGVYFLTYICATALVDGPIKDNHMPMSCVLGYTSAAGCAPRGWQAAAA